MCFVTVITAILIIHKHSRNTTRNEIGQKRGAVDEVQARVADDVRRRRFSRRYSALQSASSRRRLLCQCALPAHATLRQTSRPKTKKSCSFSEFRLKALHETGHHQQRLPAG